MGFERTFKALSDPEHGIADFCGGPSPRANWPVPSARPMPPSLYHLSVLKEAELVTDEKRGKYIYYELNTSVVEDIMAWAAGLVRRFLMKRSVKRKF